MKLLLKPVAAAVLLALSAGQAFAQAFPAMDFCTVSLQDGCAGGVSFRADQHRTLTILGRFVESTDLRLTGGSLVLEHIDTGLRATLALRPVADPGVASLILAAADQAQAPASTWGSALEAVVYTGALPAGDYRLVSVSVTAQGAGERQLALNSNNAARFTIEASSAAQAQGIVIKDAQDAVAATLRTRLGNNQWMLEGYPALRNGAYTLETNIGSFRRQVNFNLQRPVRAFDVDLPAVVGLPEVVTRITAIDPLRNRGLSGAVHLVNDSQAPIVINGASVAAGQSFAVDFNAGNAMFSMAAQGDTGTTTIDLFNLAPDGENIRLNVARWRLEDQFGFKVSKPSAAIKVETVTISPERLAGASKCSNIRIYRQGERLFETSAMQCAVEWTERQGIDFDRYQPGWLRGELQQVGANELRYRFGVVYTNPQTKQTAFYPSSAGERSLTLTGLVPQLPQISFSAEIPESVYARMGLPDDKKLVRLAPPDATSGNLVGNVTVRSPYSGLRTRIKSGANSREYLTSFNAASYPVVSKITESMGEEEVLIEAWYDKAPEYKQEMRFTAVGIPMGVAVFPDRGIVSHTEANTILTGRIGVSRGTRIEYDVQRDGLWEVAIHQVTGSDQLGEPLARGLIRSDGSYSLDVGRLTHGQRRLRVIARLVVGGQTRDITTQSLQDVFLTTYDGRAPDVSIESKTDSGSVPFSASASLRFAIPNQFAVAEPAKWFVSRDGGATWEPMVDERGRELVGAAVLQRFTQPGDYVLRAVVRNKYSGLSTTVTSDPLNAFMRGNLRVEAPSAAAVNLPLTVRVTPEGFGNDYEVSWAITRGADAVASVQPNGNTFTFTPTRADSYTIRVGVKDRRAPNTPQAWLYRDIGVRAVNPLLASATIDGPTQVEAGKTYRYTARINDVVSDSTSKNYVVRGAWLLPNGTRVESDSIDYTIQPGQNAVVFVTWVDGLPQHERTNVLPIRSWLYQWPDWTMELRVDEQMVPANIHYTLKPVNANIADLRGEPLNVTWSLPDNTTISQDGLTGRITIGAAGRYRLLAQISDSRGNVTNITSQEIEILPAPTVAGRLSVVSPYGENKYFAPGKYAISYRIESLPRGDRFQINELMVNGEKVGEFSGSSAIVDVTDPGRYTIGVRTLTQQGNYGQTEVSLNMAPAPKPACTVARAITSSGTTLTPTCTMEAGNVARYEWSYLLRGEQRTLASRSFYVRAADYGFVSNLKLTVTTTLGASETFDVEPPEPRPPTN